MTKRIKGILLVLGLLLTMVLGVMVYITQVLDPNSFRAEIERSAAQQGVHLELRGPLSWRWYPYLGLSLKEVVIRAQGSEFATVQSLETRVSIAPLLSKRVKIEGVRLSGVTVDLHRDSAGRGNWQAVGKAPQHRTAAAIEPPKVAAKAPRAPQEQPARIDLAIDRMEIDQLKVRYRDDVADHDADATVRQCLLTGFNLSGENFNLDCQAEVRFDRFPRLQLRSAGVFRFDQARAALSFDGLEQTLQLAEETLSVVVWGHLGIETAEVEARIKVAPFNARAWLTGLGVELPLMSEPKALRQLAWEGHLLADATQQRLESITLTLDGVPLSGSFRTDSSRVMTLQLHGGDLNLDNYLPPRQNSGVVNDAGSDAAMTAQSRAAPVASKPANVSNAATFNSRRLSDAVIDLSTLQRQDASVTARFDSVTVSGARLNNLVTEAELRAGVLRVQKFQTDLYDGQLKATATLDARTKSTALRLESQLNGVSLQPLLQNFAAEERLSGKASVTAAVTTRGRSLAAWQQKLKGDVSIAAESLTVAELDVERDFCEIAALLNRKPIPSVEWQEQTQLQDVEVALDVVGERVHIDTLRAGVEELALSATGESRYIAGDFDVRGNLRVTGAANPDRACQIRDRWRNRDLPLRCRGNVDEALSAKVCGPDRERLDDLLSEEVKQRIEEKLQNKLQDKLKGTLDEEKAKQVEQLLRGIFGR